MKFGDRIKQRRIELHMSAGELGSLIGKNRATIYRYEKGDIENIPLEVLDPLAEALDVTPEYLMGWTKSKVIETKVNIDGTEIVFTGIDEMTIRHFVHWHTEFRPGSLTDEEYEKLVEYAKFLISIREK